jgi:hypothetical protein
VAPDEVSLDGRRGVEGARDPDRAVLSDLAGPDDGGTPVACLDTRFRVLEDSALLHQAAHIAVEVHPGFILRDTAAVECGPEFFEGSEPRAIPSQLRVLHDDLRRPSLEGRVRVFDATVGEPADDPLALVKTMPPQSPAAGQSEEDVIRIGWSSRPWARSRPRTSRRTPRFSAAFHCFATRTTVPGRRRSVTPGATVTSSDRLTVPCQTVSARRTIVSAAAPWSVRAHTKRKRREILPAAARRG